MSDFHVKMATEGRRLCQHFGISGKVTLHFTNTRRGRCYPNVAFNPKRIVSCDIRVPDREALFYRGWRSTLAHELTHAILFFKLNANHGHGHLFAETLYEVAKVAFLDPREYNWRIEYKTVNAWARERSLLVEVTA